MRFNFFLTLSLSKGRRFRVDGAHARTMTFKQC